MPRMYMKTVRASWSQESSTAVKQISERKINIGNASKSYGIYQTLKRQINKCHFNKGILGRPISFINHELQLVAYIKKMENTGFPPTTVAVRKLAYAFTLKNNLFNMFKDKEIAGYDWLRNFTIRHPELSIRKAKGISIARGLNMCREEVYKYFQFLLKICEENNFFNEPSKTYDVDETSLQLNNDLSKVIAIKGSREHHVIFVEKGEPISVIAEGNFLPPYCIFKGKRKRPEFEDNLPSGSRVEMAETSDRK